MKTVPHHRDYAESKLYRYVQASGLVDEESLNRVLEGVLSGNPAFLEIDPFLTDLSAMPIDRHHLRRPLRLQRRFPIQQQTSEDEDSRESPDVLLDGESPPKEVYSVSPLDQRFADELVRRGFLNRWQMAQFLAGRTKFTLGRYRILDALGLGGYGHVFLGQAPVERPHYVAIKVLPLAKATSELTRRFLHEIDVQRDLSHPNLVRFLDSGRDGNVHYMVHEFIDGGDLRELFRREGPLPLELVAVILTQVSQCLHYLHENGVVHRDIKPANVLLERSGFAKLSDLGLAVRHRQAGEGRTTDNVLDKVAGTVDYMAPDQILHPTEPTPAWDIFALGCTLYQLVSGTVPFPEGDAQQKLRDRVHHDAKDVRFFNQRVPFDIAELLREMLDRNPAERIPALEVARRLGAWCV